jgi:CBS domain-containing protein
MSFWIYNLGVGVPVSEKNLSTRLRPKAINELDQTARLHEIGQDNTAPDKALHDKTDNAPAKDSFKRSAQAEANKNMSEYRSEAKKSTHQPIVFAEQIMSSPVNFIRDNLSFNLTWQRFVETRFRHFPIIDLANKPVGIVSDRDMLKRAATMSGQELALLKVSQVMQSRVLTASPRTTVRQLCEVMFRQHIGALPITDEHGQITGIVTRSDILRGLINHGPLELWA